MRILYILRNKFGTMGSAASSMIPINVAQHHEVKVLALPNPDTVEPVTFFSHNLEVITIETKSFYVQIDTIFSIIKSFKPDIIHIFGRSNLFQVVRHLRHRFLESKIIVDIRSPLLVDNSKKANSIREEFKGALYYVDHLVACELSSLKTYIFEPILNYTVVPIGVDLKMFPKLETLKPLPNISKFVFIGSLFKKRKIIELIEFFGQLQVEVVRPIYLDIFGDGSDRDNLKRFIKDKGWEERIRLFGSIPQKDLFLRLREYDAGIAYVPYELYSMAPSLKSLEYSAACIPVLASDTDGHIKFNTDHGFCFKLFPNNINGFKKIFKNLIENGFDLEHIESNRKAVFNFDWKHIVETKVLPLYDMLFLKENRETE